MKAGAKSGEAPKARVYSHAALPGLSVLSASFNGHAFAPHRHDSYSVGIILSGVNAFSHRGSRHHATAGTLSVVSPDESHTGETCTNEGWRYLNLFIDPGLLESAQRSLMLPVAPVHFAASVIDDQRAVGALRAFAVALASGGSTLEVEQLWLLAWHALFVRHGKAQASPKAPHGRPAAVARAREILDGSLDIKLSLTDLARECDVSVFHLARHFTAQVGQPPHAYHLQRRVEAAKSLILSGSKLTDAAAATGFADQAHLSRHFLRQMGVSPGSFSPLRKNVQYKGPVAL